MPDDPYEKYQAAPGAPAKATAPDADPYAKYQAGAPAPSGPSKPTTQAQIDKSMGPQTQLGQLYHAAAPISQSVDTFKREAGAAGRTVGGMLDPLTYYHAFADKPTDVENQQFTPKSTSGVLGRFGLGVERLIAAPIANAGAAAIDIGKSKDPYGESLKAAPEAIGTGAGLA